MFATTFQSLQSSFFLPSSPFNILNHFSTSFSAVQELRAELQTLEQGVGSNDGEAELDGSGWIWMDLGKGLNATAAYRCSRYIMVYLCIIHVYHVYIYI